ncbi:hypothetical protein [Pelomonas cellulosilytica]|uniref:Uncharacterized protein n=1 Tax=Pelomonas cellulosilytica TaxID=2906762 RepID=A0ABS8XPY2_9BURK|nr:hypothetical protein [Pelomonas sp. P8]MCE4553717.1 hypothetical protein [Pelomonas sp. P8]
MLTPITTSPNAATPEVAVAPAPARRAGSEPASAVVTVSASGARAAATQDAAKVATGAAQASADVNQDGTVSDQEQLTEDAQRALKKALLEGGPGLDAALQAYQSIASLADVQR